MADKYFNTRPTLALPTPVVLAASAASNDVPPSGGTFADLAGTTMTAVIELPAPAWVRVDLSGWFRWISAPTNFDMRMSWIASGATTLDYYSPGISKCMRVDYYCGVTSDGFSKATSTTWKLNAGTTTIKNQCLRVGTMTTARINYPMLAITPIAWA